MAFSNQLVEAQAKARLMWDSMKKDPSKLPRINTMAAILGESTARLDAAYSDPVKKRQSRVFWINRRKGVSVTDGRPGCTLNFSPLDAASKVYTQTRSKHDGFSTSYREFETSIFDRQEVTAEGILGSEKVVFEDLNAHCHSFLNDPANLTNYVIPGQVVDPSDNTIVVAPERWTPKILDTAKRFAIQAGMIDPFIISGNALWDMLADVKMNEGMNDNIGYANRVRGQRIYFDFTLDGTLSTEKFFLVDKGVLTFLNRVDWKNTTPESIDGASRQAWSYAATMMNEPLNIGGAEVSTSLVGLDGKPVTFKVDRHAQRTCVSGVDFKDQHGFNLNAELVRMPDADGTEDEEINGGTFTGKYTGIFAFKCGNPAEFAGSGS